MLYLLSGKDDFRREEAIHQLKARMKQLPTGEHNITELEAGAKIEQLIAACNTTPFLCDKRMVIARGMIGRAKGATSNLAQLTDYVPSLPEETHLILVEDDEGILRPLAQLRKDVYLKTFDRMRPYEIATWINERVRSHQVRISPEAARALAELGGTDLRLLDQEIDKLATHAPLMGTIDLDDVRDLVHGASPDIFAWHDAIAEGRAGSALAATHRFLDDGAESAEYFAQVVALVRRLFVTREILDERRSLQKDGPSFGLSGSTFVQDKLRGQAMHLSSAYFDHAYRLLQETDVATKMGRLEGELALELVIAELAGIEPVRPPIFEEDY